MNEEQPTAERPNGTPRVEAQQEETQPVETRSQDPRRRLRELLAIPERERSDELWDEIVQLEIQLAPGNRAASPQADTGRRQEPGRRPEQVRRQEPPSGTNPARRFFKRPRRGPGAPTKT
jgi:hypothetical protein